MRKIIFRTFAAFVSLAMCIGLALPTYAADYSNGLHNFTSHYQSFKGQTGCGYLNAYPLTSAGVIKGTPLRIWSYSTSGDQTFKAVKTTGGYIVLKVQTAPSGGSSYELMVNRSSSSSHNAILWSGNDAYYDSNLKCTGTNADSFRFELANYSGEYLNAKGSTNGSVINFQTGVGSKTSSQWHSR